MTGSNSLFERAATAIMAADGVLVTAGAGMGVDSGLPDFRGPGGFWRVYPALARAGLAFEGIANPAAFRDHPERAWGFYGHRLHLYRETRPGPAFHLLQAIAGKLPNGAFVYTSNVDGHFQKAGFQPGRIWECHGSIHHLQCLGTCRSDTWRADDFVPEVDEEHCLLLNALPRCPHCGGMARPNILMFGDGDGGWLEGRAREQEGRFRAWRQKVGKLVVVEIGAGTAIPAVRWFGQSQDCEVLVRINPSQPGENAPGVLAIGMGGAEALNGIMAALPAGFLGNDQSM